jgi:hypothetical protein
MTTPSSPPISLKDVAGELGLSSVGLSLSDSRVRTLAGVPSGPISLHNLLGKSAYTPMSPIAMGGGSGHGTTGSFLCSVAPDGGIGPYSYSWVIATQGGTDGSSASIFGSSNLSTVQIAMSLGAPMGSYDCGVVCTVTDSTSRSADSNAVGCTLTSP